jgi:hypothetical protein
MFKPVQEASEGHPKRGFLGEKGLREFSKISFLSGVGAGNSVWDFANREI